MCTARSSLTLDSSHCFRDLEFLILIYFSVWYSLDTLLIILGCRVLPSIMDDTLLPLFPAYICSDYISRLHSLVRLHLMAIFFGATTSHGCVLSPMRAFSGAVYF